MKSTTPGRFAIALVQPSRPLNVGYVARTMGNFDLKRLYIVDSKKDLTSAAVKFASHVPSIISKSKSCSFDELRSKFRILVGSTAIEGVSSSNVPRSTIDPKELAVRISGFETHTCIVFGRDTTGLTNKELASCDMIVRIPAKIEYPTLNISHAAAILFYELSQSRFRSSRTLASSDARNRTLSLVLELAEELRIPKYKISLIHAAFKNILGRGLPTSREVFLLTGILRKAMVALRDKC